MRPHSARYRMWSERPPLSGRGDQWMNFLPRKGQVASSRLTMASGWGSTALSGAFVMALGLRRILPAAFAHDHRFELFEFDEIVGLPPQLIGDHGRLRADGRTDRNPPA